MARKKAVKVKAKPRTEVDELMNISSWCITEAYKELQGMLIDMSPQGRITKRDRAQTAISLANVCFGYINCKYRDES